MAQPIGKDVRYAIAATLSGSGDVIHPGGTGKNDATLYAVQFNDAAIKAGLSVPQPGIVVVQSPYPARKLAAYHVVVQKGFVAQVQQAGGGGSQSGGSGNPLQGATNAVTRALAGGAPISRGASSELGVGADVRTEFTGINSYPPDTQIQPQEAKDALNVDSVTRRGALGKRPGIVATYPQRTDVVNAVAAINAAHMGRSINALPAGFFESGNNCILVGYDSRTDLGKGISSVGSKRVRALPAYALWHPQRDVRHVRPSLAIADTTAASIQFSLVLPATYQKDGAGTRLASVDKIIVLVSTLGFPLDRDNQDSLNATYLEEYTDWDGTTRTINDAGTVAVRRYYTVWFSNKKHFSKPFKFYIDPT
jgi:hypothetical protein